MTAWSRLRAHLLPGNSAAPDQITDPLPDNNQENRVTSTITPTDQIAELRVQIDAIWTEAAADPAAVAEDLREWRSREGARQDRVFALEQQIRTLGEYGTLVDAPGAMDAVRRFLATTAEARAGLADIAQYRAFEIGKSVSGAAVKLLQSWLTALGTLAAALPGDLPDAERVIRREYDAWFRARNGFLAAVAFAEKEVALPFPEADGGLPPGYSFGLHREGGA